MRQTLEEVAILVTADVTGLYPSIPYSEGLEVLRKQYDKFMYYKVHAEDIIEMADFVSKNIFFKLNSKSFKQISGTFTGNKFALHIFVFFCIKLRQIFSRRNL